MKLRKNVSGPILIVLLSFILSACVTLQNAFEKDAPLRAQMAYVYGKFHLDGDYSGAQIALQLTTGAEGRKAPIHKYLPLKKSDDIYAVEVPPGVYEFGKIVFLNDMNRVMFEKNINQHKPVVRLDIESGKAYYLGDYTGEGTYTHLGAKYRVTWRLKKLQDNYAGTTATFKSIYKRFASIEKVNLIKTFQTEIVAGVLDEFKKLEQLIVDRQYAEAVALARRYAEKDVPYAQVRLGYMYEKGLGVRKSPVEAGKWYHKAAQNDYREGMRLLGLILLAHGPASTSADNYWLWAHMGTQKDGFFWINRAAREGDLAAMAINCGFAANQKLADQDRAKNYAWCELATEHMQEDRQKLKRAVEYYSKKAQSIMNDTMMKEAGNYKSTYKAELEKR